MQTMQSNREGDNYGGSSLSTRFKNRFKILNKKNEQIVYPNTLNLYFYLLLSSLHDFKWLFVREMWNLNDLETRELRNATS